MKFEFKGYTGYIVAGRYPNGSTAWQFVDEDGSPLTKVTLAADIKPKPGYIFVKDYAENAGVMAALVAQGFVKDTGQTFPVGHAEAKIARVLKEIA